MGSWRLLILQPMVRLHLEPSVRSRSRGSVCKRRIETTPLPPPDDQRFLVALPSNGLDGTGTAGTARPQSNIGFNWDQELLERVPVP